MDWRLLSINDFLWGRVERPKNIEGPRLSYFVRSSIVWVSNRTKQASRTGGRAWTNGQERGSRPRDNLASHDADWEDLLRQESRQRLQSASKFYLSR